MELTASGREKARRVRLVLMDVDGVLTDGRLIFLGDGTELKIFHARDGVGIRLAQRAGIEIGVISGRRSVAVDHRCRELGMVEIHQGRWQKLPIFEEILGRRGIRAEEVGYVGDDLVDLPVIHRVGLSATVADARPEIREAVDVVSSLPGGYGAVREILEAIIRAHGKWEEVVAPYVHSRPEA